jgi:hypothetical protein
VHYLDFLGELHTRLEPRHYLEIGVRWGQSLGRSRCCSIGIDPAFAIDRELHAEVHLFRTTSDEYFSRPDPLAPTGGEPFDLAFIDGLHLFEFALRDFVNTERHSRRSGVIVFDDILPRSVVEANRERATSDWTGDIYSIVPVLAEYRPDLLTIPVDTRPTGLLLVMGLDPDSTVLADNYDDIVARFRRPDPQPVPHELMDRTFVQPAQRVLDSAILPLLAQEARSGSSAPVVDAVRRAASDALGAAYCRSQEPVVQEG